MARRRIFRRRRRGRRGRRRTGRGLTAPCPIPIDEENSSPAEIVAAFTTAEFLAASEETSPQYDGLVLAKAVAIVQRLTDFSMRRIAGRMGVSTHTISNWRTGNPVGQTHRFDRSIQKLAQVLLEEGIHSISGEAR